MSNPSRADWVKFNVSAGSEKVIVAAH